MRYYLLEAKSQKGPYYSDHLKIMWRNGTVPETAQVRPEDSDQWFPVSELSALFEKERERDVQEEQQELATSRVEAVRNYFLGVATIVAAAALAIPTNSLQLSVKVDPEFFLWFTVGIGTISLLGFLSVWAMMFKGRRGSFLLAVACAFFGKNFGVLAATFIATLIK